MTALSSCLLGLGAASCGDVPQGDGSAVETKQDDLFYVAGKIWGQRDIPVCWQTSGNATEKEWVRQALRGQRSWSAATNINFTGWGTCGSGATGILISAGSSMATSYLARTDTGIATMTLDFGTSPQTAYTRCINNSLTREQCIKTAAIHEFGHAIGYAHEHNRSETPASCTSAPQGTNGDNTFGVWDGRAIMAYCDFTTNLSPLERRGSDRLYRQAYGDTDRLGDYNGDGRDDILCHDVLSGDKWIDFASSGQFTGTNWSRAANWCNHDAARLFTGDFNGDGRTDMLCHDVANGNKWIDFADSSGQFGGTDWSRAANWCSHASARLFVGDFNGDGRDDMLCHDIANGNKWIDFADSSGQFNGTDWSRTANWCSHSTARLFVGDFNGDGRDDMLCHDVANGDKWIDFADSSGQFNGTDWSRAAGWCNHDTAELHIGDFNGDGRVDMLCHDTADGRKWIDYADSSGQFGGTDWSASLNWCNHNSARLFVGDVDGDGRDDMLCHDVANGTKWVDYADTSGRFAGTNWSLAGGWCGHEGGELH